MQLLDAPFLVSTAAVVVIATALWAMRERWPAGLAAWTAYALMLAPVSGLVHTGHHLVADHYSYLSCVPWALLAGGGVIAVRRASASGRLRPGLGSAITAGVIVWLLGLASLTWNQVRIWTDTETLWRHALEVDPRCVLCHNQLGAELGNRDSLAPLRARARAPQRRPLAPRKSRRRAARVRSSGRGDRAVSLAARTPAGGC